MKYIYYKDNGRIVKISNRNYKSVNPLTNEELNILEVGDSVLVNNMYIEDGVLKELPSKTNKNSIFNFDTKQWVVVIEPEDIKNKRNKLLTESDWTDTLSSQARLGDTIYNQWQDYRQALRDIPQQDGFPDNVIWPTKPE